MAYIDTVVMMIHGAQLAQAHQSRAGFEEKLSEHASAAEEFISKRSTALGLKMMEYVCGVAEKPAAAGKRGRKWSDWEI